MIKHGRHFYTGSTTDIALRNLFNLSKITPNLFTNIPPLHL